MIDLKREQQATMVRPAYPYTSIARFFFGAYDLVTGSKITLSKVKLLEILASIPYRAWEIRQYNRMTYHYSDDAVVREARTIVGWGREAQDNEYVHLRVINVKMAEDNEKNAWFLAPIVSWPIVTSYAVASRILAFISIERAFLFNAEFEDHAERVYAQFVADHPEWDSQPVTSPVVKEYTDLDTWGDVFRRISLDERDHMNDSLAFGGRQDSIVAYEGMPSGERGH